MQSEPGFYALGEVAAPSPNSFVDGPFGSNLKSSEYTSDGVRIIQLQNIGDGHWIDSNHKFINKNKARALSRHLASPGDIAIAKMADPVARACLLPAVAEKFVVVADCIKLAPDRLRFDASFIKYAINSVATRSEAVSKSTGTTRLRINLSKLKTVRVWSPPLPEQRRIAEILDTLDEAIRKTEQVIAKLQQMKQGLLHDLLTRGIDENGELRDPERHPEQFKDSPLGRIPRGWEVRQLQAWVLKDAPITYGIVQAGPHISSGVPYIRTGDMSGDHLQLDGLLRTSRSIAKSYQRSEIRAGEIVCAIRATVGKVLLVPDELDGANLTQGTARIAPCPEVDGRLLLWALRAPSIQKQINAVQKGTTFQEITLGQLRELLVGIPMNSSEQERISDALEGLEIKCDAEQAELVKLRYFKQGLMDDLLTGRVRVPVEPKAAAV
jgi:type I restriction enzyme S subunit